MNSLHKGITTLLRSAITGEKLSLPEGFRLEDADELIRSQSLLPMAYIGAYNCGISPDTELMRQYKQQYFRCLLRHEQQMRAVESICRAFEENDIDYALLKGCIMKPLYPNPEMRTMGDADILIRKEQYDQIQIVMKKIGFEEEVKSAYDIHWISRELLAELHHRLYSKDQTDLNGYFENIWERIQRISGSRCALSVEDAYLHIFTHMTKHFRHCGIGARQVADIWVYRKAHSDLDERKIFQALEKLKLSEFHANILGLLAAWFDNAEDSEVTDTITEFIFNGGSWGSLEVKMHTEALIHASGKTQQARGKSVLRTIFPDLSYLRNSYSILLRHPWLYPFFWPIRWVDILLHRRKNIRTRVNIIRNMSNEKVMQHKEFLDSIGLRFYER